MPIALKQELLELHFFAIIPIPQSQKRSYRRGHDSAYEVAHFFSRELNVPILPLLELTCSDPEQQTGKSRFEREVSRNPFQISECFPWNNQLMDTLLKQVDQGRCTQFLIIDDVITSGATLAKASVRIRELIPRSKCFAGSLGYRPRLRHGMESRSNPNQENSNPPKPPQFRFQTPSEESQSDAQFAQDLVNIRKNP